MPKNKTLKGYRRAKWLYFALSIIIYFVPYIVVTSCLLPLLSAQAGKKIAIGFVIVILNAIPFLRGVMNNLFAHFPFLNLLALVYILLWGFFTTQIFQTASAYIGWIELTVFVCGLIACFTWRLYRKAKGSLATAKTLREMGK